MATDLIKLRKHLIRAERDLERALGEIETGAFISDVEDQIRRTYHELCLAVTTVDGELSNEALAEWGIG